MAIFNSKLLVYQRVDNSIVMFHRFWVCLVVSVSTSHHPNTIPKVGCNTSQEHFPSLRRLRQYLGLLGSRRNSTPLALSQRATASLLHQS